MRLVLAAALVIAVLTGCSLFMASLEVVNDSTHTVKEVRLSPTSGSSAGDFRVIQNILPGHSYQIENIYDRTYDMFADSTTGGGWERRGFTMQPGRDYTWTLVDGDYIP